MDTGEKIRMLRISKGWTQEELGKRVGVQRAAINKYEKGTVVNIKRSTLQKLATALEVSAVDLLDDSNPIVVTEDGIAFESGIASVETELIEKIKKMSKSHQRFVLGLVDDFLEYEKEENND